MNSSLQQNLITTLGLDTLPAEKQQQILSELGKIAYQRVLMRALDDLTDKQKDELDKLLENNVEDADGVYNFLAQNLPNFETIVTEEISALRDHALKIMSGLK